MMNWQQLPASTANELSIHENAENCAKSHSARAFIILQFTFQDAETSLYLLDTG